MSTAKKPLVLVIMDGWGYSTKQEYNAVAAAKTPNLDRLARDYTSTLISGSGLDVGLPDGQMGNSEVGHTNIGAGRRLSGADPHLQGHPGRRLLPERRAGQGCRRCRDQGQGRAHHGSDVPGWRTQPRRAHHGHDRDGRQAWRRADLLPRLPGWPRRPAAQCPVLHRAVRRPVCPTGQGSFRLHDRSLLRHGPRQPLGSRAAGL